MNLATQPRRTPDSVNDFHATMLHLLGVNHERLMVKFQGLDARLTGMQVKW